jgi:WD40 repeat protein
VNALSLVPYSNQFVTGSGDKTVSLWDARTGICELTLYGHQTALNDVVVSMAVSQMNKLMRFISGREIMLCRVMQRVW